MMTRIPAVALILCICAATCDNDLRAAQYSPFLATITPPPPGLVLHWALDEGTGTSATDSSGNDYTGTITGAVSWVAGTVGAYALEFNPSGEYVENTAVGSIGYPATVSLWVKLDATPVAGIAFFYGDNASATSYWNIYTDTDGSISFWDRAGSRTVTATGPYNDGNWHHLVGVFLDSGTGLTAYVDGSTVGSSNANLGDGAAYIGDFETVAIGMGRDSSPSGPFEGGIDDVRVYDIAADQTLVNTLYALGN